MTNENGKRMHVKRRSFVDGNRALTHFGMFVHGKSPAIRSLRGDRFYSKFVFRFGNLIRHFPPSLRISGSEQRMFLDPYAAFRAR
jgi:hypothetical protein